MSNRSSFVETSRPGIAIQPSNRVQGLHQPTLAAGQNATIEKSAKDFESILLTNWLQSAEQSFGTVPGGDSDEDQDAGKDQLQGMAMQSLGASMTAAGGIGIAKMISTQLHKADDAETAAALRIHASQAKP